MQHLIKVLAFAFFQILAQPCALAQSPTVLAATEQAFVFELAPTPSLTKHLGTDATAKLATPAQHTQMGLEYPLWLADANFSIKTRPRERQALLIQAKRGNPALKADLLLALNNRGSRSFEPQTLIFDNIHTVANAPMPPQSAATQPDVSSSFSNSLKSKPAITFAQAEPRGIPEYAPLTPKAIPPIVETIAAPSEQPPTSVRSKSASAPKKVTPKDAPQATPNKASRASTAPALAPSASPAPAPAASAPSPTSSVAALPAQVASAPARPPLPTNRPPIKPLQSEPSWLDDLPFLAGAVGVLGLLGLLLVHQRNAKAKAKRPDFSMPMQPTEQATNTVFGLTAEEAEATHQKWLSQQILQNNNKQGETRIA